MNGVATAGEQRGRDRALVAIEPAADARVDGIAQALHESGITQLQAAALGRRRRLDRAHRETGSADTLEKQVAREIEEPGRNDESGGKSRAFNSTKLPTSGAVPFFTDSRTRSSFAGSRGASICVTRNTKRSVCSRMSRVSTKPESDTE